MLPASVGGLVAYQKAVRQMSHEQHDLCGDFDDHHVSQAEEDSQPHPEFTKQRTLPAGSPLIGGGFVMKAIRGMGTIYDWRDSDWTPANGGKINPILFVHHIPVIPNMAGIADFARLRDVLVRQNPSLMVQSSTDRDGNIALFTPMDFLCYHAQGANQFSTGCEHMHAAIDETWSRRQLRASAWLVNQADKRFHIPTRKARVAKGAGVVRVVRYGQISHEAVSNAAGFRNRIDPGRGYDWEYVKFCVNYYREKGHFESA